MSVLTTCVLAIFRTFDLFNSRYKSYLITEDTCTYKQLRVTCAFFSSFYFFRWMLHIKLFLELFVSGCEMSTGMMMYCVPNGNRAWQKFPLRGSMLRGCDLFMTRRPVHNENKTLGGGGGGDFPHLDLLMYYILVSKNPGKVSLLSLCLCLSLSLSLSQSICLCCPSLSPKICLSFFSVCPAVCLYVFLSP